MMQPQKKRMGESLMGEGLITQDQLMTALEYQKSNGMPFGQIVVKLGFITPQDLTGFLAKQYSLPIVDLRSMVIPINLVKSVPWELVKRHKVLPIHQDGMTLTICTADPTDFNAIEELQYATGKQIDMNLAPLPDIVHVIAELETRARNRRKTGSVPSTPTVGGETTRTVLDDKIAEEVRSRSSGALSSFNFGASEVREALIALLLEKGVITRQELYDAVAHLLVRKGVIGQKDLEAFMRQPGA